MIISDLRIMNGKLQYEILMDSSTDKSGVSTRFLEWRDVPEVPENAKMSRIEKINLW